MRSNLGKLEIIEIIVEMIKAGEEIGADVFCMDYHVPRSLFLEILKWINPDSKMLK